MTKIVVSYLLQFPNLISREIWVECQKLKIWAFLALLNVEFPPKLKFRTYKMIKIAVSYLLRFQVMHSQNCKLACPGLYYWSRKKRYTYLILTSLESHSACRSKAISIEAISWKKNVVHLSGKYWLYASIVRVNILEDNQTVNTVAFLHIVLLHWLLLVLHRATRNKKKKTQWAWSSSFEDVRILASWLEVFPSSRYRTW